MLYLNVVAFFIFVWLYIVPFLCYLTHYKTVLLMTLYELVMFLVFLCLVVHVLKQFNLFFINIFLIFCIVLLVFFNRVCSVFVVISLSCQCGFLFLSTLLFVMCAMHSISCFTQIVISDYTNSKPTYKKKN